MLPGIVNHTFKHVDPFLGEQISKSEKHMKPTTIDDLYTFK